MPGTKIINVLRDDRLEDILEIFRTTLADEVIFVLPKKSRAFTDEDSFATLADESRELSKGVLILSENLEINKIAAGYDLGVLTSDDDQKTKKNKSKLKTDEENSLTTAEVVSYGGSDDGDEGEEEETQNTPDEAEKAEDEEEAERETGFAPLEYQEESAIDDFSDEAILTVAPKSPKSMNDILGPDPDNSVNIKVNKKVEKPAKVEIKKEPVEDIKTPLPAQEFKEKTILDEIQNVWQRREIPKKFTNPSQKFKLPKMPIGSWLSSLSKKTLYIYGIGVVILFGSVIYVSTGKADIFIKPRSHTLKFDLKVSASDKFATVDSDLKRIPGQLFSVDKKIEESFPATGEKDVVQKARGMITVYNEYGTTPQILIATTRFESADGLIFRTLKTITVPGTKVQNGQIIPGSVTVEIIADKAGQVYNVEPGKFAIPAFREKGDNDRFQKFYARSDEALKGGIVGKARVVTEGDYINAKKKIEARLIDEAGNEIKSQAAGLKIIGSLQPVLKEVESSAKIDEAVDTLTVSGSAEVHTVGFREEAMAQLLVSYVESINPNVTTFPDKLKLEFKDVAFNSEDNTLNFTIAAEGLAYSKVDKEKIITDLMGKGEDFIKEYIKTTQSVASARVVLSPFWVWKVPSQKERIKVMFEYD